MSGLTHLRPSIAAWSFLLFVAEGWLWASGSFVEEPRCDKVGMSLAYWQSVSSLPRPKGGEYRKGYPAVEHPFLFIAVDMAIERTPIGRPFPSQLGDVLWRKYY
jgi:hypothetical protein